MIDCFDTHDSMPALMTSMLRPGYFSCKRVFNEPGSVSSNLLPWRTAEPPSTAMRS